jgi:excisionase family DNA binding protein
MTALAYDLDDAAPPSPSEMTAASAAARLLTQHLTDQAVTLKIADRPESVEIPANAFRMMVNLLQQMGNGIAVTVMPLKAELTTQQAAHVLNVSRPFVIKLVDEGRLKARQVGTHRKLLVEDVLAYKAHNRARRRAILSDLVELDQAIEMEMAADTTLKSTAE